MDNNVDKVQDNTYYPVDKVLKLRNRTGKREYTILTREEKEISNHA